MATELEQVVTDFLGKKVPVSLQSDPTLPVQGPPVAGPAGAGAAPGGGGPSSAMDRVGGGGPKSGTDLLGIAKLALQGGAKGAELLKSLQGPQATRGDIGGKGTTQDSNTSLSDTLRDAAAASGAIKGAPGAFADPNALGVPPGSGFQDPNATGIPPGLGGGEPGVGSGGAPVTTLGGGDQLGAAASAVPAGAGAALGGAGLVLSLVSALAPKDASNAAVEQAISAGLLAMQAGLSESGVGIAIANAVKMGTGLYADISQNKSAEQTTIDAVVNSLVGAWDIGGGLTDSINEAFLPSESWRQFTPTLGKGEGQQGIALNTLAQALPYVKSKEELGELLNSYRYYVTTTTGDPLTGGGTGIYDVATIPGMGPVTHGTQTPTVDWGPYTSGLQGVINNMMKTLPGDAITSRDQRFTGETARRLWDQFNPTYFTPTNTELTQLPVYGAKPGQYSEQDISNALNSGVIGRTPVWDPESGQWFLTFSAEGQAKPKSAGDVFQMSPTWAAMMGGGAPGAGGPASLSPDDLARINAAGGGFQGGPEDLLLLNEPKRAA